MLDQDIVRLAQAIREHETGNRAIAGASGELPSRYQFLPSTWKAKAKKYLGDANAEVNLQNENKVVYSQLKDWKDQGYNPGQIAAMWNAGEGIVKNDKWKTNVGVNKQGIHFDTPHYVESVYSNYQKLKKESVPTPSADVQSGQEFSSTLPYRKGESPIVSTVKAVANIPGSLARFGAGVVKQLFPTSGGKQIGEAVVQTTNPDLETQTSQINAELSQNIQRAVQEKKITPQKGAELLANLPEPKIESIGKTLSDIAKNLPMAAVETLVPKSIVQGFKGDFQGMVRTLVNDPAGQILPVLLTAEAGAKALKVKGPATIAGEAARGVARKTGEAIGNTVEYGVSQATGLSQETIRTVVKNPKAFEASDVANDNRITTASKVKAGLDAAIEDLGETGKQYTTIRESQQPVNIPQKVVTDTLTKYGVTIGKNGKLVTSAESVPLSPGDISAIEHFLNQYGPSKVKTNNAFLNARQALDRLSDWDATKTDVSNRISKDLRRMYDAIGKKQIKNLEKTDAEYAPMYRELKQLRKDYLNADGTLKDGAINKIANLLGKGKEPILYRLEQVSPGIADDIRIVKALEDVQYAQGQKVGAYGRQAIGIGGGFATGGALGALVGAILTSPSVAVWLLKTYGRAAGATGPLLRSIELKLMQGQKLTSKESLVFTAILQVAAQDIEKENKENQTEKSE